MAKRNTRTKTPLKKGGKLKFYALIAAVLIALIIHNVPTIKNFLSEYLPFWDEPRKPTVADGDMGVHFLDVGQGDSILIVMPSGETMLIDASTSDRGDEILEYIDSIGIKKLNYFVMTHPHSDHIGGAKKILEGIPITNVIMPDVEHDTSTFEKIVTFLLNSDINVIMPKPNDQFELGSARLTVLGPTKEYKDLNNASLVIRLDYGETSFMFTGDAEYEAEEDMLSYHSASKFKADVLKLGHHGSSTSSCKAFLDAVSPRYAVVSCGKDNEYGHPHTETVNELNKRGINYFRTDKVGNIVFSSDGKTVEVIRPAK